MLKAIDSTNFFIQGYLKSVKISVTPINSFILSTLTSSEIQTWNNPIINFLGSIWKVITFFFLALVCWQSSKSVEHAKKNTSFLSNVQQKLVGHLDNIPSDKVLFSRVTLTPGNNSPIVKSQEGYQPHLPIKILEEAMPPGTSLIRLSGASVDLIDDITLEIINYEQPKPGKILIKISTYKTNNGEIEANRETKLIATNENPLLSSGRKRINELAGIENRIEDDLA